MLSYNRAFRQHQRPVSLTCKIWKGMEFKLSGKITRRWLVIGWLLKFLLSIGCAGIRGCNSHGGRKKFPEGELRGRCGKASLLLGVQWLQGVILMAMRIFN
ncbi:hypothetical protein NPIL_91941 [Nephila pilipes]|uniref:Uncharacterized protein n=1 Tax=Nephila pilipes TaxID=299642 RepID=A0A8X6PEQ8_NEPPI|nr:hypothetical protein NPIL_91941 [Nephila pilipes]